MRFIVIAFALALLMAGPATAVQKPNRGQCRQLTKQIETHSHTVARAQSRGNAMWAGATQAHINRLDQRRMKLCPDLYSPSARAQALEKMKQLAKMAAQAAVSFFTLGGM